MTIEECYRELGGDFADVSGRLPSSAMIERFAKRFLEDGSFDALCSAVDQKNREVAFRSAHTLKGVCANLGFTRLFRSASALTESLRPETAVVCDGTVALLDTVRQDYQVTVDALRKLS